MANLGYAGVSPKGQRNPGEIAELEAAGYTKLYIEKATGSSKTDRTELAKLLRAMQPGDVVTITRLDRLAKSKGELMNVLNSIGKAGADFRSLTDVWADTTTPTGRLMFRVLAGLADFEREVLTARVRENQRRAKQEGGRIGRRPKLTEDQKKEVVKRFENGETQTAIARAYGVDPATIAKALADVSTRASLYFTSRRPTKHRLIAKVRPSKPAL